MSLGPGTRLGPYEVVAAIGAGGMGEVYRATDTNLGRQVAIKVLPEVFAQDSERLARFEREAKTLASLNHPHIAQIYGLEKSSGVQALVMELVEGEDLSQSIARGPIPIDDALPIAKQIAEALEAAHEQGIIHRDLKPANIKVREDGAVKVLDFGLAKLTEAPAGEPSTRALSMSPTITSPAMMTGIGVLLGTAAYMAPEQAKGKPADKRSDIWAFGCVLFEMLTGKGPFGGDDITDTIAAIVKSEPNWSLLPASTPASIRTLLRRCLEKDRRRRLDSAAAIHLDLEDALSLASVDARHQASDVVARPGIARNLHAAWTAAAIASAACLVAAVIASFLYVRRTPPDSQTVRFGITPPDGWTLALGTSSTGAATMPLAISPDGRRIAIVARDGEGRDRLWLRSLDALTWQALPATDGAASPFWSPDSRFIGFVAGGKLKKIDIANGSPITLCDAAEFRGGAWSADGVIVFATTGPLQKVAATGGVPTAATTLAPGEQAHWRPSFLLDGRHFFYRVSNGGIYVGALDSSDRTLLVKNPDNNNFMYTEGYLLFLREVTLMAQPFDTRSLSVTGEPVPIAEKVQTLGGPPSGVYSVATNGTVVYQPAGADSGMQLTWFGRTGRQLGTIGDTADYGDIEIAPDGKRAAVTIVDPAQRTRDIWLVDLERGLKSRFTFDPADEESLTWSPDSKRIVFTSIRNGRFDLYEKQASSGAGAEAPLLVDNFVKFPWSWSPDSRFILYSALGGANQSDLMLLSLLGDKKPVPFVRTPYAETQGQFSPDGRWIAYVSNDSGTNQVFVEPFSRPGGKAQVSSGTGIWPRWRRDGKEIFYLGDDNQLMAAQVDGGGDGFEVGAVQRLFTVHPAVGRRFFYSVSADGQRFLVNTIPPQSSTSPFTVVLNWTEELKARVPTK